MIKKNNRRIAVSISPTRTNRLREFEMVFNGLASILLSKEISSLLLAPQCEKIKELIGKGTVQIEKWGGSCEAMQLQLRLDELRHKWTGIKSSYSSVANQNNQSWKELVSRTIKTLSSVCCLPHTNNTFVISPRAEDSDSKQEELNESNEKIKSLEEQLSKAQEQGSSQIQELSESLRTEKIQNEKLTLELISIKNEQKAEEIWNKRIKDAFDIINAQTNLLEEERKRAKAEFWVFYVFMAVIVLFFSIWNYFFISWLFSLESRTVSHFQIIPWTTPLPFLVALFWVSIIQRNKANRKIFRLREEIFKIKYVEGLLLSINKLSQSTADSIIRINNLLDEIIRSYIRQTESFFYTESSKPDKDAPFDADDVVKIIDSLSSAIRKGKD